MWVIKLGLDSAQEDWTRCWLDELNELGGGRIVIVPGVDVRWGGPALPLYPLWPLHSMGAQTLRCLVLLAMAAQGLHYRRLCPALQASYTDADVTHCLRRAVVPLWLPLQGLSEAAATDAALALFEAAAGDGETWQLDAGAESVAAWLSDRWNAERLVLVRAEPVPVPFEQALAEQCRRAGRVVMTLSPADLPQLMNELLSGGAPPRV